MKTAITILAGLLAGVLVAAGVLAAFVFVGPDPVGLRPTPPPTLMPSVGPSPSAAPASASPSAGAGASGSPGASGSFGASASPAAAGSPGASGSAGASGSPGAAFHIGQPALALVAPQVGGRTIALAVLRGKPVWLYFVQTTARSASTSSR